MITGRKSLIGNWRYLSRGLGREILNLKTRVRFPLALPVNIWLKPAKSAGFSHVSEYLMARASWKTRTPWYTVWYTVDLNSAGSPVAVQREVRTRIMFCSVERCRFFRV